ncbi:hypothetical protein FOZ61_003761, partial [Perkinsus olseni]
SAGCKKVAATTAKSSENVDVSKLISRAKDAGKVSGDEVDSMDEYACGSDAYKYFYLRASLDEDIRGYVNKEVKAKINKEDLATQLEWDKLTYTPGSTRMESHLTRLLTLADRVSMSRGSEVSDRSSAVASYAAMRREVRRWAQYNEKPVSAANAAEENDIEVGLSIALGDMDKDACWRCINPTSVVLGVAPLIMISPDALSVLPPYVGD